MHLKRHYSLCLCVRRRRRRQRPLPSHTPNLIEKYHNFKEHPSLYSFVHTTWLLSAGQAERPTSASPQHYHYHLIILLLTSWNRSSSSSSSWKSDCAAGGFLAVSAMFVPCGSRFWQLAVSLTATKISNGAGWEQVDWRLGRKQERRRSGKWKRCHVTSRTPWLKLDRWQKTERAHYLARFVIFGCLVCLFLLIIIMIIYFTRNFLSTSRSDETDAKR